MAADRQAALKRISHGYYRTLDGRFRLENTWCPENTQCPNWLLTDLRSGATYRCFLLSQAEKIIDDLSQSDGKTGAEQAGDTPPSPDLRDRQA